MSPSAGADADPARDAILEAADRLFYRRGIAGVGMDDVRDAAAVSLRRVYRLFPSKRALVAAWLEDRHARWMRWFAQVVRERADAGVDPLLAAFDALDSWASSPEYRGCAFLNAIAETTEIDDAHRAAVAGHKRALVEFLAELTAGAHPQAPSWVPAAIAVLIDGAIVQSAVFGSRAPIRAARMAAAALLDDRRATVGS